MPINMFSAQGRRLLGSAVLAVLIIANVVGAAPGSNKTTSVSTRPAIHIDNFSRVDEQLYRGSQPRGRDFADLKALGIKTIVNLTSDDADPTEQALTEAAGMTYVSIPMTTRMVPTAVQIAQFLSLVNDPEGQPVYVHCVGGRHRTGVMTAIYRMTHDGWSGDQAFKEMKQFKYGADFLHPEFKDFVYGYRPEFVAEDAAAPADTAAQH